jgi:hypothetical protein
METPLLLYVTTNSVKKCHKFDFTMYNQQVTEGEREKRGREKRESLEVFDFKDVADSNPSSSCVL